ncbi:MAG: hypothetical protein CL748_00745 [Chloroflexi bacterium]|nr:hypothetical protein [Chloroflexota bacterium]|tara:strand:- start:249 stop:1208 length:960 start_codon:yes stop_codon:yes gene_type:complete
MNSQDSSNIYPKAKNPFDLIITKYVWSKHFGSNHKICILTFPDSLGKINTIAPMKIKDDQISFIGDKNLFDYQDLIYSDKYEDKSSSNHISEIFSEINKMPNVKNLIFESVSEQSYLIKYFKENNDTLWKFDITFEDVCPIINLEDSWENYLSSLKKKYRHELKRKIKRINSSGKVDHYELVGKDEIMKNIDCFFELLKSSSHAKSNFLTPEYQDFFVDLLDNLSGYDDLVRLSFLEFEKSKVASSLSFVINNTRFLYNSGYDPKFSDLSVGLINHAYSIKLSIEQNIKIFDFMRGDERYKYHLGAEDTRLFTILGKRK